MGRDRRCLHGVGGIFIPHILPIGNFILDLFFTSWYCSFTTNGEGEHTRHTSRKVARTPREKEASRSVWSNRTMPNRKLRLPSRTRERRATGWRGEDRPRRDGGTEKRLKRRPKRKAHRSNGGRADQQGPRLRHEDRAVKLNHQILFPTSRVYRGRKGSRVSGIAFTPGPTPVCSPRHAPGLSA